MIVFCAILSNKNYSSAMLVVFDFNICNSLKSQVHSHSESRSATDISAVPDPNQAEQDHKYFENLK